MNHMSGLSGTNDRFHFVQAQPPEIKITTSCRFIKPGVGDGPDSVLKSVIRATSPDTKGGFTPKHGRIPGINGRDNRGILAGLRLKGENSRVAAIIGSYPAILPL